MARDYMMLGSTPPNETCAQVGTTGYTELARAECRRYIELIKKKMGDPPGGAYLAIRSFPHDFGSYFEVVCYFDSLNESETEYALSCEGKGPLTWDDVRPPEKTLL